MEVSFKGTSFVSKSKPIGIETESELGTEQMHRKYFLSCMCLRCHMLLPYVMS